MWQTPLMWKRPRGLGFTEPPGWLRTQEAGPLYHLWLREPCVWKNEVAGSSSSSLNHAWQHTGLEKWTQRYNYVQCFGRADLIPFDVFYIWQMFTFASQRTQSYPRHTHIKKKKNHTSVIHMHFLNNKGYNHHPHNTLSAHCLEYLI